MKIGEVKDTKKTKLTKTFKDNKETAFVFNVGRCTHGGYCVV